MLNYGISREYRERRELKEDIKGMASFKGSGDFNTVTKVASVYFLMARIALPEEKVITAISQLNYSVVSLSKYTL